MAAEREQRQYPRHQMPVHIESLAWEHAPLEGKDISAGGIFLTVRGLPTPPEPETRIELSFQVAGESFRKCPARIVWTQATRNGTWGVGLEVSIPEKDRHRLARRLEENASDPRPLWHA